MFISRGSNLRVAGAGVPDISLSLREKGKVLTMYVLCIVVEGEGKTWRWYYMIASDGNLSIFQQRLNARTDQRANRNDSSQYPTLILKPPYLPTSQSKPPIKKTSQFRSHSFDPQPSTFIHPTSLPSPPKNDFRIPHLLNAHRATTDQIRGSKPPKPFTNLRREITSSIIEVAYHRLITGRFT